MSETNDVNDAIKHFPRLRARTLRFGCGAPRSAQTVGDGSRALFLRSDGPEDLVTALWLSWFDESGEHHETKLADPRELLGATADSEDVPAEEKARRERAREGGTGIVGYSADDDGNRIVFTINGRLFLTDIDWNDETGAPEPHTRELAGEWLDEDPAMYTPVLNPRIAPDGEHVLYTTGSYLMLVDIGGELGDRITAVYGVSVEDEDGNPAENTWKIGLAEFVAGEEMDRYDGFWWAPDSQHVLFESFDTADEPTCHIPMIIKWPGAKKGFVAHGFHDNVDLLPTVKELLHTEGVFGTEYEYDGISYAKTLMEGADCAKDSVVLTQCCHVCQRSARFDDYVYIRTVHGGYHLFEKEMLFNVKDDPHELHNLAVDHPELCVKDAKIIADWVDEMMKKSKYPIDPMWTVMKEGGPEHARGALEDYIKRLSGTSREYGIPLLRKMYPNG